MKVLPFTLLVPDDKSVISEHITLPYFYQYLHRHDEWQITYVQEGEGTLIAGSDMHAFKAGDVFVIGAKLPHLFKSNPEYFSTDLEIKACSIYFNPEVALGALFKLPEMAAANAFLSKNKHGFKVPAEDAKEIATQLLNLHNSSGGELLTNLLQLIGKLQGLKGELSPLCSDMYSLNVTENEGRRLSKVINYITEKYHTQLSLEEIADAAFMTPQAFCRYFKKHTGHTFISFLNEVRINDACKNLIFGDKAGCVAEVAYGAGFNSITNFNRVFKSVTGQSPRTYVETYNNVGRVAV
jgi:AraC-like DNA-binding protein